MDLREVTRPRTRLSAFSGILLPSPAGWSYLDPTQILDGEIRLYNSYHTLSLSH